MAVANGKVRLLAGARDNDTAAPYNLVPGSPSGSYSIDDYDVPSVDFTSSLGFTLAIFDTTTCSTVLNAGGSRRNELKSSARTNATWTADGTVMNIFGSSNSSVNASADNTGTGWVNLTWDDGFNPSRTSGNKSFTVV